MKVCIHCNPAQPLVEVDGKDVCRFCGDRVVVEVQPDPAPAEEVVPESVDDPVIDV